MKTAISIIGHLRTWDECKNNFLESFSHLSPDVFVSTYDLQYNYHPAGQHWMGGQSDIYLSVDEIKNKFKEINVIDFDIENISDVILNYEKEKQLLHINFMHEIHTVLQNRKIIRAIQLMANNETNNNFNYDIVIKIRGDIWHKKVDYNINNNEIIISKGNVFPNDVLIAAKRNDFINLFQFIYSEFYNQIYFDSHEKAPHNLLLRACQHNNLNIIQKDIMEYVLRKTGKNYYNNINE